MYCETTSNERRALSARTRAPGFRSPDAYKLQLQHTRDQHDFLLAPTRPSRLAGRVVASPVLRKPALPLPSPHAPPNITAVFFTGHDMAVAACLPDPSWRQHQCQPLHSPSPTSLSTRGARLGFGNHSATFRLLGFVGRRRSGVTTTSTGGIRTDTSTVAS